MLKVADFDVAQANLRKKHVSYRPKSFITSVINMIVSNIPENRLEGLKELSKFLISSNIVESDHPFLVQAAHCLLDMTLESADLTVSNCALHCLARMSMSVKHLLTSNGSKHNITKRGKVIDRLKIPDVFDFLLERVSESEFETINDSLTLLSAVALESHELAVRLKSLCGEIYQNDGLFYGRLVYALVKWNEFDMDSNVFTRMVLSDCNCLYGVKCYCAIEMEMSFELVDNLLSSSSNDVIKAVLSCPCVKTDARFLPLIYENLNHWSMKNIVLGEQIMVSEVAETYAVIHETGFDPLIQLMMDGNSAVKLITFELLRQLNELSPLNNLELLNPLLQMSAFPKTQESSLILIAQIVDYWIKQSEIEVLRNTLQQETEFLQDLASTCTDAGEMAQRLLSMLDL